ncbi:hypothetical protein [uncultured Polaribacter sp.]|nr:hypothetical protein [uncultured Polaribacter sp.]
MRKEQYTASAAGSNNHSNFVEEKQTWTDNFVQWFRDFLENGE